VPDAVAEIVSIRLAFLLATLVSVLAAAANATLIFDDPYMYEAFRLGVTQNGVWRTAWTLVLNLDLHAGSPHECFRWTSWTVGRSRLELA
jgi:hypothetical protein